MTYGQARYVAPEDLGRLTFSDGSIESTPPCRRPSGRGGPVDMPDPVAAAVEVVNQYAMTEFGITDLDGWAS